VHTALLILAILTTLMLAGALVDFTLGFRRIQFLKDIAPAAHGPRMSIVAPARNEARHIETAVRSLLALDYPALEIIVVNDRSTDGTGAILERLAREHPQLKVVQVSDLPAGWLGKNHALQLGADAASGVLLLFTDADVVFEPTALRRAVALMERERIDHLAALPEVKVPGLALNVFVTAFSVFFSLYTRPWKARDPRSRHHIGVGAFNLIRADAYRAIGGHRPIALRPDDDLKLGKLVKKHGYQQDVAIGSGLMSVEWYASIPEMIDGLMKNAFAGVNYSLWAVVGSTLGLFVMNVWPFIAIFVTDGATRMLNAVSVALLVAIVWHSARFSQTTLAGIVGYPFAALLFGYIIWRSALIAVVTGTVKWRGTAYPLKQLRANRI